MVRAVGGRFLRSGDDSKKAPVSQDSASPRKSVNPAASAGERDMGTALRKIYQRAVEETIPAEMLDLLGKLD